MNQNPAPIASATRTLKTLAAVTRLLLWVVLLAWGLFALTWGTLQFFIVPRIGEWRPELERWASASVGVPVRVGEIRAEPRGETAGWLPELMPSLALRDVQLFDPQGRVALQLPLVRASISVGSLWRLGFEQIVIDQPVLDVRRTAQGRIEVAGLDFSDPLEGGNDGVDWFFSQHEFVIQGGTVRWTDDLRSQPPLALDALNLVVRNTARTHHIRLDATPPPDWGQRFSLRARLREPLLNLGRKAASGQAPWQRWDGELYADFTHVDVAQLRAYADFSEWGLEVRSGQGALRAWADVERGQITGATADLALQGVAVQLGPRLPALLLDEMGGRLAAQWDAQGFGLTTHNLRFRTREGAVWPGGVVHFKHTIGTPQRAAGWALTADQLDLAALTAIATRLPLASHTNSLLATLQPVGRVEGLSASWQGAQPLPAITSAGVYVAAKPNHGAAYEAKGRVVGLALRGEPSGRLSSSGAYPLPGRPGLAGATVDFDLNQSGGRAQLSIENGAIDLPGIFEEPRLPVNRLEADASWRIEGERIDVEVDTLRLANADVEGTAQLRWHTSDATRSASASRFPGVLDLTATLSRANATRVHRYLPLTIDAETRRYVREAVRSGTASRVDFRLQGEVYDMPFDAPDATGVFRIGAQLEGLDFAYVPTYLQEPNDVPWPVLRSVTGELVLDRAALQLTGLQGNIDGAPHVQLSQAEIRIDDVAQSSDLVVNARAQGSASEVLGFVRNSPLNAMTGQALAQARIGGPASVQFQLNLPLFDIPATRVAGTVQFAGNDLQISPDAPLLGRAVGTLQFSEAGFNVTAAQARLYGGEVRFEGGMRPDASGQPRIQFRGQGTASAEGLRDAELGFVSRLFQNARGSTGYTAQLGFLAGVPELQVSSNLQGMAINLPAPLNKPAETSLPLRFESSVLTSENDEAHTDRLLLQLGSPLSPMVNLHYERDIRGDSPRVLRGSVGVGLGGSEVAPLPTEGVLGNIRLEQLDADAWEHAFTLTTGSDTRGATPIPLARADAAASAPSGSLSYLPSTLAVRADRLTLAGRAFNRVVLGGVREGNQWRANIDADELNGYVAYRQPGASTAGSVFARLARLNLAPTVASDVEKLLQQPASVPALDIVVDELRLGSRNLGRVEVEAINRSGGARSSEWSLTKLQLRLPEARLSATGNWAAQGPNNSTGAAVHRRTALDFQLDIDDSGQLLERFGHEGMVKGGKGRMQGRMGWLGSPLALDYPSLSGELQLEVERGQFLKVDPGAAKLLGVLSLQALPRRLVLDFRDVFSEGFAFDFVRGDARIDQGVVFTNNLQMKGINAAVLMEGTADLAREQQDLKVVVVPEVNAGTASLIATAINPAVGLGTFLAQFLLRQPLQSAATQEFHITGGWADPQVEKIQRVLPSQNQPNVPSR